MVIIGRENSAKSTKRITEFYFRIMLPQNSQVVFWFVMRTVFFLFCMPRPGNRHASDTVIDVINRDKKKICHFSGENFLLEAMI